LATAIGRVLKDEIGVVALEIALPLVDAPDSWTELRWRSGTVATEHSLASPPQQVPRTPQPSESASASSIAIPIGQDLHTPSLLTLHFERHALATAARDPEWIAAAAQIVMMACHSCDLVAKVAGLSRRAYQENRLLRRRLNELGSESPVVAVSGAMRAIVGQCELAAPHTVSVLLRGESGTGKEVLARFIHGCSDRAAAPFVAVNCAALPEALIESELFGHEQGAFTGAVHRHVGRFERASGGTLFLDEVAELPISVQAKLLRALQERTIERVGGREPIAVDVRVIAATHRPIEQMLENGSFRTDLYYRLNVFPIEIPPLRERPEDIPELTRRKLTQMCERMGREVPRVSRSALRTLCAAPWPGNVRELENHLERALILNRGEEFVLPGPLFVERQPPPARGASKIVASLDDALRAAIEAALKATRGKLYGVDGAAALLGVKPSTLQAKMAKLGIARTVFI
jgi:transcriptional regulator with GAF, ATPase, and Fis domain